MAGDTVITVVGNLTADPEIRTTASGATVVNLTIASTPSTFNRKSNQWEDGQTLFLRCSAWDSDTRPFASNIHSSLSKGMRVIAQGRLTQRSYEARDGSQRTVVELQLMEIGPALTRNTCAVAKNNNRSGSYQGNNTYQGGMAPAQPTPSEAPQGKPDPNAYGHTDSMDQDPWSTFQSATGYTAAADEPEF